MIRSVFCHAAIVAKTFKDFTLAVAGGKRRVDPNQPKVRVETQGSDTSSDATAIE